MAEVTYAPIEARWATELAAIERAAFPTVGTVDLLSAEDIEILCGVFPEGGFVALDGDKPVAMGVGILIDFDFDEPHHSLDDLCGEHSCGNHRDDADWYYGVTIAVDPHYRRLGNRPAVVRAAKGDGEASRQEGDRGRRGHPRLRRSHRGNDR